MKWFIDDNVTLHQDEWQSGSIAWLIDAVGSPAGVQAALRWLAAGPFKERALKVVVRDEAGSARITTLGDLAAARTET